MTTIDTLLAENLLGYKKFYWVPILKGFTSPDKRLAWFKDKLAEHFSVEDDRYQEIFSEVKRYCDTFFQFVATSSCSFV